MYIHTYNMHILYMYMYLGFLEAMSSLYFVYYLWRIGLVNWRYVSYIMHTQYPQNAFNCQAVSAKTGNHNTWCPTEHTGGAAATQWVLAVQHALTQSTVCHTLMLSGYGE